MFNSFQFIFVSSLLAMLAGYLYQSNNKQFMQMTNMSIWALVAVVIFGIVYSIETLDLRPGREAAVDEDVSQVELDEIGPLKVEDGVIEFKQFLIILKVCAIFANTRCLDFKKRLIAERRTALKEKDEVRYREIIEELTSLEEPIMQHKLMALIDRLKVSDEVFQKTMSTHYQDRSKTVKIMQVQQEAGKMNTVINDYSPLTKEKVFEVAKAQVAIQQKEMGEIIKNKNKTKGKVVDEDTQMTEVLIMQAKSCDYLFAKTGVEEE
jgi:hypothetical protein